MLEHLGYHVLTAERPTQALELLAHAEPRVYFIQKPFSTGEVGEALRHVLRRE